jgi:O-acetyl-ADP-ribose deacetylase (regulator of RNase III)
MDQYIESNHIMSQILPNIFIGNYLAVDNKIIKMFNISGVIVAAEGIDTSKINIQNIIKLEWTEQDDEDLYPGIIKSFGFLEEHFSNNSKILVVCRFGMNRSVTVVLAWLMMYHNMDFDYALNFIKNKRPIVCPIPTYINKLIKCVSSLKNEFVKWTEIKTQHNKEFLTLFRINIGNFEKFDGKYPKKFTNISELTDEVINMKSKKEIVDKAKSKNNRLRKDQPIDLIELNEKECKLLLHGYYTMPKLVPVDIFNKVRLTNKFVLDLDDDAIVNTANEALMGGGGMDLLIHTYAGDSLKIETSQLPNVIEGDYYYGVKCLTGDAKITSGHNLNSKYIIHVVTPYLDSDNNTDMQAHIKSYKSILKYVDGKNIRKLTIGPISTGYYGYPMLEATVLGLLTIREFLEKNYDLVDQINLWIYNETQYKIYEYLIPQIL